MDKKIPYYKAEEIAEKSWMITNAFVENSYANCYLIEGEDYALLIDSILGMGNLKAFCETLTDKPILVANTHSHSDHVGGNFHFDHCFMPDRDIRSFQDRNSNKKDITLNTKEDEGKAILRRLLEKTFIVADNVEDLFSDFPFLNVNHGTLQFAVIVRELVFNFDRLMGLVDNVDEVCFYLHCFFPLG